GRYWLKKTGTVPPFGVAAFALASTFHWLSAFRGTHPMAGGLVAVTLDRAGDYAELRRATFDVDLVPLPDALALPAAREAFNRGAVRVVAQSAGSGTVRLRAARRRRVRPALTSADAHAAATLARHARRTPLEPRGGRRVRRRIVRQAVRQHPRLQ